MNTEPEYNAPFRIRRLDAQGNYKDWTIYKLTPFHSNNRSIDIYFRSEGFFVNPPSNYQAAAIESKLAKYGYDYVTKQEFDEIRSEFGHAAIDLNYLAKPEADTAKEIQSS